MKKILFILVILMMLTSLAMADEIVVTIDTEKGQKVEILTYEKDIDEKPTGRYAYYEEGYQEYRIDSNNDRCVSVIVDVISDNFKRKYPIAMCVSNIDKGISARVQGMETVICILRWGERENR